MKIEFANLQLQYQLYKEDIDKAIHKVLDNSNYIMGSEVQELEKELSIFTGVKHSITCSSGTDALILSLMALNIGKNDEVITTPFTFIATAETIALVGAKPVFVDISEDDFNIDVRKIEEKITLKTKAIMPVSLYGQPANMEEIEKIAKEHNLKVILDGAQSFGSEYQGKKDSNFGDISTTSFFPAKPLGCYGDGGAVFTNSDELADKIRSLRVHGQTKRYYHKYIGIGGRLDTIQAGILLAKLPKYSEEIELRQKVAKKYEELLREKVSTPKILENRTAVFAQYSIRVQNRNEVKEKLSKVGVPIAIHYPKPLHLQEAFKYLEYKSGNFPVAEKVSNEILSLPMNPFLTDKEIEYICNKL